MKRWWQSRPTSKRRWCRKLSKRAAEIHSGTVDASVDNMLCVTNDGRKIGLDVRLMNPMLPDDPNSKLNVCVQNVLKIWEEGKDQKLTQLLFCDLSTPKNDGNFNVYDDIRKKLIAAGVPENEIEFIHNADTETKKGRIVLQSALRRCASFARKYSKNGSRDQRAIPTCGSASSGCWLETQRHDPAQRSYHPAGQYE